VITASQIRGAAGAEYYCAGGAEAPNAHSYYLDAVLDGEPPGRWSGQGAQALGLSGVVTDEAMRSVFGRYTAPDGSPIGHRARGLANQADRLAAALAREPDATPDRVEEICLGLELADRSPVTGYDFTFSPVKSVTVVHTAAWRAELAARSSGDRVQADRARSIRSGIESAVQDGARAALEYLSAHATTRVGRHGAGGQGRWMAAPGLVIASFFQHTNRNIDPQLHQHNAVLNRVLSADGVWRALDGRDLLRHQHAAGAIARAVVRERLAAAGLDWELRDNGHWELTTAPEALSRLWSSRDVEITERFADLVQATRERLGGRDLTPMELARVKELATLGTRRAKVHDAETVDERADRVVAECHAVGQDLTRVYAGLDRAWDAGAMGIEEWSPETVISQAIAACGQASATFRAPDLTAQILDFLPPVLGLDRPQVIELAERLTQTALSHPDLVQVTGRDLPDGGPDGEPVWFARPTDTQYAAAFTLEAEQALRRLAIARGAHSVDADAVHTWLDDHVPTIGADQRSSVAGIAASDARAVVLVGPAGTGKSFALGALAGAWAELSEGGRVIGLATSQIATQVLADDGIPDAANIAAFLAAQQRLDAGTHRPLDQRWALGQRDVVLVDEASMVSTAHLSAIRAHVEAAGARLVLTGDPHQLGPVDAGGALGLLDQHAETYTLTDVRRFTEPWEREASLRLRQGDAAVLAEYDTHGRLLAHDTLSEAIDATARAWVADHLDHRTVLAIAASNDQAAAVSLKVRDQLIALGLVEDGPAVRLGRDDNVASVGDLVQARRIDHALGLTNREIYRVTALHPDGAVIITSIRSGEARHVPAEYVGADLALAYASTVHAAQGLTVDATHLVTTGGLDPETLYVAMTRGRTRNTANVSLTTAPAGLAPGRRGFQEHPTAMAALAAGLDRDPTGRAALVELEADAEHHQHAATVLGQLETLTRVAVRARTETHLDQLAAEGHLTPEQRATLCADQATEHLSRLLRAMEQAGHDPEQLLREAVTTRSLDTAHSLAQVIAHRITRGHPVPEPALAAGPRDDVRTSTGTTTGADVEPHAAPGARRGAADLTQVGTSPVSAHAHSTGAQPSPGSADAPGSRSSSWAPALPAGLDPTHAQQIAALRERALVRADVLGARTAADAPAWARTALGPVPAAGSPERDVWEQRAGIIATHREAAGWTNPDRVLPPPVTGVHATERRAWFMAAWDAAGHPPFARPAALLTDGQLRIRIRAAEQARAIAPRHAAADLREAEQAREQARQDAVLTERRAQQAEQDGDRALAEQLRAEAIEHRDRETLHELAALEYAREVDVRGEWAALYAPTLAEADHALAEAHARRLNLDHEPDCTTAQEWLALDAAHWAQDDEHRRITEADLLHEHEPAADSGHDHGRLDVVDDHEHSPRPPLAVDDIKQHRRRDQLEELAHESRSGHGDNDHEPLPSTAAPTGHADSAPPADGDSVECQQDADDHSNTPRTSASFAANNDGHGEERTVLIRSRLSAQIEQRNTDTASAGRIGQAAADLNHVELSVRMADLRSHDAQEPVDQAEDPSPDAARHHRWVLDEALRSGAAEAVDEDMCCP